MTPMAASWPRARAPYPTDFGPGRQGRAGPGRLVGGLLRGHAGRSSRRPAPAPSDVACVAMSGQMMGVVLVDAQRRGRCGPAVIWADTRAQRGSRPAGRAGRVRARLRAARAPHRPLLLPAQVDVAARARPGGLGEGDRPAGGQGLPHPAPHRAALHRPLRRLRHQRLGPGGAAPGPTRCWRPATSTPGCCPRCCRRPRWQAASGRTRPRACGLLAGTPVVVGGGDGACAVLGAGLPADGSAANATLGSSAWVSVAHRRAPARPADATS